MAQYRRQIYYYETDRMSIVHNSNYLRSRSVSLDAVPFDIQKTVKFIFRLVPYAIGNRVKERCRSMCMS